MESVRRVALSVEGRDEAIGWKETGAGVQVHKLKGGRCYSRKDREDDWRGCSIDWGYGLYQEREVRGNVGLTWRPSRVGRYSAAAGARPMTTNK